MNGLAFSAPISAHDQRHTQLATVTDTGSGRWTRIENSWAGEQRVGWWAMSHGGEPWRGLLSI